MTTDQATPAQVVQRYRELIALRITSLEREIEYLQAAGDTASNLVLEIVETTLKIIPEATFSLSWDGNFLKIRVYATDKVSDRIELERTLRVNQVKYAGEGISIEVAHIVTHEHIETVQI